MPVLLISFNLELLMSFQKWIVHNETFRVIPISAGRRFGLHTKSRRRWPSRALTTSRPSMKGLELQVVGSLAKEVSRLFRHTRKPSAGRHAPS